MSLITRLLTSNPLRVKFIGRCILPTLIRALDKIGYRHAVHGGCCVTDMWRLYIISFLSAEVYNLAN